MKTLELLGVTARNGRLAALFCVVQNDRQRRQKGTETAVFGLVRAAAPHICAWTARKPRQKLCAWPPEVAKRMRRLRHTAADPAR